ncbi:MAG: GNAT family N-acetyltransferase [Candidatus Limnocylindria bacterium]
MAMRLGARHPLAPDRAFGGVELRRLDWDSEFFGYRMGVLALAHGGRAHGANGALGNDLRLALAEAAADGYAHVILRAPADRHAVSRAAEHAGMRLVDVALDLQVQISGRQPTLAGAGVRRASPADLDALRIIAEDAFELSRFAADPFFSKEQVAAFYRQWITNLCEGLADVVLVAESNDEIVGFTTCVTGRDATGRIPLIATSEAHRRQGVGRALVDASLRWFAGAGPHHVRVKTQAANYPALALYHRLGFTVVSAELTFSATLGRVLATS